jgi:hypothetical protein
MKDFFEQKKVKEFIECLVSDLSNNSIPQKRGMGINDVVKYDKGVHTSNGRSQDEVWKPIIGYENFYEISNTGKVRSLNYLGHHITKTLKVSLDSKGYYHLNLYKNGKSKTVLLHRLIAQAFIPNRENKPHIDHINTIRTDNRIENLRWCTRIENQNNPITRAKQRNSSFTSILKINASKINLSKSNNRSKIINQYSLNKEYIKSYPSLKIASKENNIPMSSICCCCRGIMKHAGNYIWSYSNSPQDV